MLSESNSRVPPAPAAAVGVEAARSEDSARAGWPAWAADLASTDPFANARKHGETEQRLYLLNAWRESPVYTDRERAALAWTEAVTLISETHAPDDVYARGRAPFSEVEA